MFLIEAFMMNTKTNRALMRKAKIHHALDILDNIPNRLLMNITQSVEHDGVIQFHIGSADATISVDANTSAKEGYRELARKAFDLGIYQDLFGEVLKEERREKRRERRQQEIGNKCA